VTGEIEEADIDADAPQFARDGLALCHAAAVQKRRDIDDRERVKRVSGRHGRKLEAKAEENNF
jgi:hypothetical protein